MTAQLKFFFRKVGVLNESSFSLMNDRASWPSADDCATPEQPLKLMLNLATN